MANFQSSFVIWQQHLKQLNMAFFLKHLFPKTFEGIFYFLPTSFEFILCSVTNFLNYML